MKNRTSVVSTKSDRVQIRIGESDRKIIERIRLVEGEFNISQFFRKALRSYGKKLNNGIGSLKIR